MCQVLDAGNPVIKEKAKISALLEFTILEEENRLQANKEGNTSCSRWWEGYEEQGSGIESAKARGGVRRDVLPLHVDYGEGLWSLQSVIWAEMWRMGKASCGVFGEESQAKETASRTTPGIGKSPD